MTPLSLFRINTKTFAIAPTNRTIAWFGIGFMTFMSAVQLIWPLIHLPFHIAFMNEGWNAVHTAHAMRGEALYPSNDSFMFNNYPPLSFYIVGLAGMFVGDDIVAGRIVSLLALLVIAGNVAQTVRNLGGTALFGIFAGVLVIAIFTKSFTLYVGKNDPQLLAHAIMATGFTVFTASPRRARNLAAAAFIMVLAGFVKHNIFAMPLATTVWLLQNDRRALARWIIFALAFLSLGFAACGFVFGGAFYEQLLSSRAYNLYNIVTLLGWTQGFIIPILLWLVFASQARPDPQIRLVSHLLVAGGIVYVITRAGEGVSVNALFDWVIGAGIATGVLLSRVGEVRFSNRYGPEITRMLIVGVLCLRMILLPQHEIIELLRNYSTFLATLRSQEAALSKDIAILKREKGPILCQDISLCYWSGHEAVFDEFNAGQAILAGARDVNVLKRQIISGKYHVLQIYGEPLWLLDAAHASGLSERPGATRESGVIFTQGSSR
jgi:hypothetical protein